MDHPKPLMMACAGPEAGGSVHLAWLHAAGRGFAFLQQGNLFISTSLHKGEGCLCAEAAANWFLFVLAFLHHRLSTPPSPASISLLLCGLLLIPMAAECCVDGQMDGWTDGQTMGIGAAVWEQGNVRAGQGLSPGPTARNRINSSRRVPGFGAPGSCK